MPADLPLIGRAHEMGLMLERWHLARQGEGQIVTVIGEAGIGKSRMIEALQEELAGEAHARINLQCSPYHSDSALYPVIQYLRRAAHLRATDPPDARIEKLGALLAHRAALEIRQRCRCWPSCCRSRWPRRTDAAAAGATQGHDACTYRRDHARSATAIRC